LEGKRPSPVRSADILFQRGEEESGYGSSGARTGPPGTNWTDGPDGGVAVGVAV
jgi:hypothetical protein